MAAAAKRRAEMKRLLSLLFRWFLLVQSRDILHKNEGE